MRALCFLFFSIFIFSACKSSHANPLVIWTDRAEIVSYLESFNASGKTRAIAVLKNDLSAALPPAPDENPPDILIGAWLKNPKTKSFFLPLNELFLDRKILPKSFYPSLLKSSTQNDLQYLLPVSFNLPALIFSSENEKNLSQKFSISIFDAQQIASDFNKKNAAGFWTKMGFLPTQSPDFLYLCVKLGGFSVLQKRKTYIWEEVQIQKTLELLKTWILETNGSAENEQDFSFKYLYTPPKKYVTAGHCLFAYSTSAQIFENVGENLDGISFRWISQNGKLPIEDDVVLLGVYKKTHKVQQAFSFVAWLFNEETQKSLLEKTFAQNGHSATFGIFGGFSSLVNVNEKFFPSYFQNLLGNIPERNSLIPPTEKPLGFQSLKERVLIPYLKDFLSESDEKKSLFERTLEWNEHFN